MSLNWTLHVELGQQHADRAVGHQADQRRQHRLEDAHAGQCRRDGLLAEALKQQTDDKGCTTHTATAGSL